MFIKKGENYTKKMDRSQNIQNIFPKKGKKIACSACVQYTIELKQESGQHVKVN